MIALDPERYPGVALVVDGAGRVVRCNVHAAEVFGAPQAELVGVLLRSVVREGDREAVDAALGRCLARGEGAALVVHLGPRVGAAGTAGETRVELELVPSGDAGDERVAVLGRDVQSTVERADALGEAAAWFEALFERSQEGLFVLRNRDGAFVRVNEAAARLLGSARHEILGKPFTSFVAPSDLPRVIDYNRRRIAGDATLPETYPMRVLTRDGDVRVYQFRAEPFHVPDHITGSILPPAGAGAPLEESLDALQRDGLVDLARSLSHEFNNVLAAILAASELMRGRLDEPAEVARLLDAVTASVDDGRRLADRLRVLARPPADERQEVALNEVVGEVVGALRARAPGGPAVTLDLSPADPCLSADPLLIRQLVSSLVANALEAVRPSGQVTVRTRLVGRPHADAIRAHLEVADDGHGIPERLRRRVFQPFFTTRRASGHRGLGLAVVDAAVWALDGSLTLESEEGRGTRVVVDVPATAGRPEALAPPARPAASGRAGSGLVLVADDSPTIRNLLCEVVRALGFQVVSAADGDEAATALESMREPPYACILDVVMPGRDGIAVARLARGHFPTARIVIVSGHPEPAAAAPGAGDYDVYLHKPFRLDAIAEALGAAARA